MAKYRTEMPRIGIALARLALAGQVVLRQSIGRALVSKGDAMQHVAGSCSGIEWKRKGNETSCTAKVKQSGALRRNSKATHSKGEAGQGAVRA